MRMFKSHRDVYMHVCCECKLNVFLWVDVTGVACLILLQLILQQTNMYVTPVAEVLVYFVFSGDNNIQ